MGLDGGSRSLAPAHLHCVERNKIGCNGSPPSDHIPCPVSGEIRFVSDHRTGEQHCVVAPSVRAGAVDMVKQD